ncbi:MAG: hypothetical protein ACP6IY_10685 [Promethearchaeia archaeon]
MEEAILRKWDELAARIGISRTSLIHNAIEIYNLFINNQLNDNRDDAIKEQLNQIEELIKGLELKKRLLEKENEKIDSELAVSDIEIKDFNIVAERILSLLRDWGALPESTIAAHLQYPGWIVWTVLKKLKANKKVKVERGEWLLY